MPTFDVLLKPFDGPTDAEKRAFAIRLNVLESIVRAPEKVLVGYGRWFPLHPTRNIVVNEKGGNFDVRFEGDGNENLLVLDAGSDVVAIAGAVDASYKLKVHGSVAVIGSILIDDGDDEVLLTGTGRTGNRLAVVGQTAGQPVFLDTFAGDGDGTDDLGFTVWAVGTAASQTNAELLEFRWDASESEFALDTLKLGSGTVRPLNIYTEGNSGQLYLATDGNITVTGTVDTVDIANHIHSGSAGHGTILPGTSVELGELSTATYDDVQDFVNQFANRTHITGMVISDALDGTANISAGTGWCKTGNTLNSAGVFFDYDGGNSVTVSGALTNLAVNYIYLDYNGGTPQIVHDTTGSLFYNYDHIVLGCAYRHGTHLHLINSNYAGLDAAHQTKMRAYEAFGAGNRTSGLVSTSTGTRNLSITAGVIWTGLTRTAALSFNTSSVTSSQATSGTTGTTLVDSSASFTANDVGKTVKNTTSGNEYTHVIAYVSTTELALEDAILENGENYDLYDSWNYWYYDGDAAPAAWVNVEHSTQISRTQYNATATGLANLGGNKYGVHWVYMDAEGKHLHVVYGQGNYTAPQVELVSVPSSLPPVVTSFSSIIAKVICQEGTDTLTITYPWTTMFTSSLAQDHGNLAGLLDDDHTIYFLLAGETTDAKLYSGADLIAYSDAGSTEKARIDGATGNITTAGTVDGIDIATDVAANTSKVTESTTVTAPLALSTYDISIPAATNAAAGHATAAQITALEANTTHLSSIGTDHGYIDQDLQTSASPTFVGLAVGSADGIDCNPGSDTDTDLITVGVTEVPKLWWDDSEDAISLAASNLQIVATTSTVGQIKQAGNRFIHSYGTANLFMGDSSGNFTLSGTGNVGIGYATLDATTSGGYNMAIGEQALTDLTEGEGNVAIGSRALADLTTGTQNIGIGFLAGLVITTATENMAIGGDALKACTTGSYNVGIGKGSLLALTTSDGNMAIGSFSMSALTDGGQCVAVGNEAGKENVSGWNNTSIGYRAGRGIATNSYGGNTVIGSNAGRDVTTGGNNVLIGVQSGLSITTGANNVLIGYLTSSIITTGSSNIIIGYDLDPSAVGASNELSVGDLIKGYLAAHGSGPAIHFMGGTPQAQQAHIVDADGTLADITTKFNTLLADLEGYGLLAAS